MRKMTLFYAHVLRHPCLIVFFIRFPDFLSDPLYFAHDILKHLIVKSMFVVLQQMSNREKYKEIEQICLTFNFVNQVESSELLLLFEV